MNPRAAINDLHPFQGCPFSLLGTSAKYRCLNISYIIFNWQAFLPVQRRGWDSNPRALADKRFSRPPRYDHFDTSPQTCSAILTEVFPFVKSFLKLFFNVFASNFRLIRFRSALQRLMILPPTFDSVNTFFKLF